MNSLITKKQSCGVSSLCSFVIGLTFQLFRRQARPATYGLKQLATTQNKRDLCTVAPEVSQVLAIHNNC